MPKGDWTIPAAYEHMRAYDAAAFAAEYVTRNDAFIAACGTASHKHDVGPGELVGSTEFADHWGLRFRGER